MNERLTPAPPGDEPGGTLLAERLAAVDAMPVPPGDLAALRRQVRRRARAPRLAAAAAVVVVAALAAAVGLTGIGTSPTDKVRSAGEGSGTPAATTSPITAPPDFEVPGGYWEDWEDNVPAPVGQTKPEGSILPKEADAMSQAVADYAFAHGATVSNGLGPEMTEALTVVNAVRVRDADGNTVGRWANRFYDLDEYPEVLEQAEATIAAWEAANEQPG